MNLIANQPNPSWTIDRLRRHFGMIPAKRILLDPPPGMATEEDVLFMDAHQNRLCELVDGVLVEKAVGIEESGLASWLARFFWNYLDKRSIGTLTGEAGFYRLMPGLLRAPDVAFISWDRLPEHLPKVGPVAPDLAVEVISEGNTKKEIARKRREYFTHGARLVWEIDPRKQTVIVYTSRTRKTRLTTGDTLDGDAVLPGFKLPVKKLFSPPRRPRR